MATDYDDPVVYRTTQKVEFPLRDYFAAAALQGMLACDLYSPDKVLDGRQPTVWDGPGGWGAFLSTTAYKYADAMLKQREVPQCDKP